MKKKLIASVVSLAMALVMLTSASFAWFTVSTTAEAANVKVSMSAYKNLEIRVGDSTETEVAVNDAGDLTKWGSKVNYADSGVTLTQMATLTSGVVQTAKYDEQKRVDSLENATPTEGTDTKSAKIAYATGATPTTYKDADGNLCAVEYNMWLRSNAAQTVTAKPDKVGTAIDLYLVDGSTATKLTTGGITFNLSANTAKNVKIVALVDGATHVAKDIAAGENLVANITFTGSDTGAGGTGGGGGGNGG